MLEILRQIDTSALHVRRELLTPSASTRYAPPAEFAEFIDVLRTPGAYYEGAIRGGSLYTFSQYNSPIHGNVVVWQSNLTPERWGWYAGRLPIRA